LRSRRQRAATKIKVSEVEDIPDAIYSEVASWLRRNGEVTAMSGLWTAIETSFRTQLATWIVAFLIGILGLFSSSITERIKFALNRANLRTTQYEELASETSSYIFSTELMAEFLEKGWTTKPTMTELLKDYNASITTLRRKEFVYSSWIRRFWGPDKVAVFKSFMSTVREFDAELHSLNNEFEKVNITGTQTKISDKAAADAVNHMKPTIEKLHARALELLMALS
jgi:hypothetical protein